MPRHNNKTARYTDLVEWDKAQFRLGDHAVPVNIEITGRTVRDYNWSGKKKIRVRIEFVQDGEPSDFTGGYAWI